MSTDYITARINKLRADYEKTLALLEARQRRERETRQYADALGYQIAALEGARERQRQEAEEQRQRANDATIAALLCDAELRAATARGIR